MKRYATYLAALLLVVGGGAAVFWPVNFWRLFDDNLQPLALTQAETYCAGLHGWQNGFALNDPDVTECEKTSGYDNTTPSVANAVMWGCQGIVAGGWPGQVSECSDIFERDQLWLVKGGGITWSWSDAWPRPVHVGGPLVSDDNSRTGDRQGFTRNDQATTTTTTSETTTTEGTS